MAATISPIPFQADFTKPLDLLFQCHHRIAANLESLRRASEDMQKGASTDYTIVLGTVDTVLNHFETAGVKHTEDEEESLFPRMRRYNETVASEVFDVIERLELQHTGASSIENTLRKLYLNMASDDSVDSNKVELFADLSESLYDLYRPHIQIENEFVFPAASKLLSVEELLEVGKEMFQRRQTTILIPR